MYVFEWNGYTGQLYMRISRFFVEGYFDERYFSLGRCAAEKLSEAVISLIRGGDVITKTEYFESKIWHLTEGSNEFSGSVYTGNFLCFLEALREASVPPTRLQNQVIKGSAPLI